MNLSLDDGPDVLERPRLDEPQIEGPALEVGPLVQGLLELAEDVERALLALEELDAPPSMQRGLEGIRRRLVEHFHRLGYEQLDPMGRPFDPRWHEALAVEAGPGREGTVVRVHRRGWSKDGRLVLTAQVTVRQGQLDGPDSLPARRRRAPRHEPGSEAGSAPGSGA